jgi:hypothetical protein
MSHLCRIPRAIAREQRAAITMVAATVPFAGTIIWAMIFASGVEMPSRSPDSK